MKLANYDLLNLILVIKIKQRKEFRGIYNAILYYNVSKVILHIWVKNNYGLLNYILSKIEGITSQMEDSSITLLDMIMKLQLKMTQCLLKSDL